MSKFRSCLITIACLLFLVSCFGAVGVVLIAALEVDVIGMGEHR